MPAAQTILVFLGVLSVLVLAHELGHFVVAKRAGIKVQEFGFGYPPRLLGIKVGETVYSLNLLPLGGFVRMLGETGNKGDMGSVDDQHIPGSFASKSKRVRAAVLAAGSAMNLLLVPVLFSIGLMIGEPVPCDGCNRVEIYGVQAGSPAAEAGLQGGDVFVSLNGQPIDDLEDVRTIVRTGGPEQPVTAVVLRDGETLTRTLTPRVGGAGAGTENQPTIGIQLGPEVVTVSYPIWQAIPMGIQRTGDLIRVFFTGLGQMLSRETPAELAGPVGIAQMTGQAARAGWVYLLQFTAFLSLNLAVFNMLPIPGLDGARLLFVIVEGLRGRRVNPQTEGVIHFIGLMLLLTLMAYVSVNDVQRLVG
jgi:regulator of sigma E protease